MTQKLYRDGKGRFVNEKLWAFFKLKGLLDVIELWRRVQNKSNHRLKYTDPHGMARYIRQFRNEHKIYECF